MPEHHDHAAATHAANCDSCAYVAEVHAHSDDDAVTALSENLAAHNRSAHGEETDPEAIHDPVRDKMRSLN